MAPPRLTCRIRVEKSETYDAGTGQPENSTLSDLKDCPEVGLEIRTQWAREVVKCFEVIQDCIRPWDFIARLDGSVEPLPPSAPLSATEGEIYPARFQIPPGTIRELDQPEKFKRVERFAMASLLYEILSGRKPFEELSDDEVQHRFSNAVFPDDAISLPNSLVIYSGWSEEFSQELSRQVQAQDVNVLQAIRNYTQAHPIRTGIQVVGLTLSAISFLALPVLGVVGFTAAGPAAGSAAAAWQASIGAVQAGSLFAWCQSAAMGGSAVGGIQVAGIAGAAITRVVDVPGLPETFKSVCRRVLSTDQ